MSLLKNETISKKFTTKTKIKMSFFFLFAALLAGTLRTYQKAGCDAEYIALSCPRGTQISIEIAQYGNTLKGMFILFYLFIYFSSYFRSFTPFVCVRVFTLNYIDSHQSTWAKEKKNTFFSFHKTNGISLFMSVYVVMVFHVPVSHTHTHSHSCICIL